MGAFNGISLPNGNLSLSHLLYADGYTIMGEWSSENVMNMIRILRVFYCCSGLKINMRKSCLYGVGVDSGTIKDVAARVNCKVGCLPFVHLGIMIGANMNKFSSWNFILDIFETRPSIWKGSWSSIGGRVTLIKAVLESLPTYYFSIFKAPCGSGDGRKVHWVYWERVASPVKHGGLGICRLRDNNVALLTKWLWRYRTETDGLWRKVDAIHGKNRSWGPLPLNNTIMGVWKNIVRSLGKVKVGDAYINEMVKRKGGEWGKY
uniref:uncharacterized protein LOC122610762 n=1 Tax=Erigeron canadensis TaxID=72917 RepID=UPI001CB980CD|nr:uncharacterized protein LOC122610762 [Erigeron canadensis]